MVCSVSILISLSPFFLLAMTENQFINWSFATEKGVSRKERNVQYLGYKEDTVLECDLLENICDVNCCADKDCTEEQKSVFLCPTMSEHTISSVCEQLKNLAPPFDCVFSNTPYVGEYYIDKNKIEKIDALKSEIQLLKRKHYDYAQQKKAFMQTSLRGYKYGMPLKTVLSDIDDYVSSSQLDNLKLPDNTFNVFDGVCLDSPVFYLVDRDSHCLRLISDKLCTQSADFQLHKFLVFDAVSNVSSKYSFRQLLSNTSNLFTVETSLKFVCLNNDSLYTSTFQDGIMVITGNNMDNDEQLYETCEGEIEDIMVTLYNHTTGVCNNVVLDVYYTFIWNGSNILKMEAVYVLATVPTVSRNYRSSESNSLFDEVYFKESSFLYASKNINYKPVIYVKQNFRVQFVHIERLVQKNDTYEHKTPVLRSGNDGYNIGSPVFIILSTEAVNESSAGFEESILHIWDKGDGTFGTGAGDGCEQTQPVPFGFDALAGCRLQLAAEDFTDCAALRERVVALQKSLLPGTWLASSGERANYSEHPDLLVPILRSASEVSSPSETPLQPAANSSEDSDPWSASEEGSDDWRVLNAPACVVPAAWRLEVLHRPSRDAHLIQGARLTWEEHEWRAPGEGATGRFALWSSVVFAPMPPPRPPLSRFWERMRAPEGAEWAWHNALRVMEAPMTAGDVGDLLLVLLLAALGLLAALLRRSVARS